MNTAPWWGLRVLQRPEHGNGAWVLSDGTRTMYRNGVPYSDDGAAHFASNGTVKYYRDGLLHREDGPAVYWPSGLVEFWQGGKKLREGRLAECA